MYPCNQWNIGRSARMLVFNISFKRYFMIPTHPLVLLYSTTDYSLRSYWCQNEETGVPDRNPNLSQSQVKLLQLISKSKAKAQLIQDHWALRWPVVCSAILVQETKHSNVYLPLALNWFSLLFLSYHNITHICIVLLLMQQGWKKMLHLNQALYFMIK